MKLVIKLTSFCLLTCSTNAFAAQPPAGIPFTLGPTDGKTHQVNNPTITFEEGIGQPAERVYIAPALASRITQIEHHFTIRGYAIYDEKHSPITGLEKESDILLLRVTNDKDGSYIQLPKRSSESEKQQAEISKTFYRLDVQEAIAKLDRNDDWTKETKACLAKNPDSTCIVVDEGSSKLTLTLDDKSTIVIVVNYSYGC